MLGVIIAVLVAYALSIRVEEKMYFLAHVFDPYGYLFMDQMGYSTGKGTAQFDISYHGTLSNHEIQPYVYIGLLNHARYPQFQHATTCQDKQNIFFHKQYVNLNNQQLAKIKIGINQTEETLVSFYLYNCQRIYETKEGAMTLYVKVTWNLNSDGSHLDSKEDILPYYYLLSSIFLGIFTYLTVQKYRKLDEKPPIYIWMVVIPGILLAAHILKLVYFYLHSSTGDYFFLTIAFEVLRAISQDLMITLLLVIGFGWTVIHLNNVKDTAAPLAGCIIIANILCIVFMHLLQDNFHKNHIYDSISSSIFLMFKVGFAIIFALGVLRSYVSSDNIKNQNFLRKFGPLGFLYLISQPIVVLLVVLFANVEVQNQLITIGTDLCHLIGCVIFVHTVISFKSDYSKLDYNANTVFRSYDPLKQF